MLLYSCTSNIGSTDISSIGSTITGAIFNLSQGDIPPTEILGNESIDDLNNNVTYKIGKTDLSGIWAGYFKLFATYKMTSWNNSYGIMLAYKIRDGIFGHEVAYRLWYVDSWSDWYMLRGVQYDPSIDN